MDDAGFSTIVGFADARDRLHNACGAHGRSGSCPVGDASGRVLATDVTADRAVPHYKRAAMDGFAVRASDTFGASERSPATVTVAADRVETGHAVPVHTGSELPPGADGVVMIEDTERRGGDLLVYEALAVGENVSPAGEDVESGQRLYRAGERLRMSDLAMLRATGHESAPVVERPKLSAIPTGEELVPAGVKPAPGEIVETNGLLVSTLARQWGAEPTYRDVVTDDSEALKQAIGADTDHDIVVTTGGSSVGDRDLVADAVADIGEMHVHGVGLTPGHPVGFGTVDDTVVLVLPGYPVSCLVTAVQFLRPAIAWLTGTDPTPHPTVTGRLAGKIRSEPGNRTFARVRFAADSESEARTVEPVRTSGAGVFSSVTVADGWVEVPDEREGIPAGETVTVQQWERPRTQAPGAE
jgi:molybdopterin molybdotransferase